MVLSIAFCTRNRPTELKRAIDSLLMDADSMADTACELLIIDDGALEVPYVDAIRKEVEAKRWCFRYLNKSARPGLFQSRLEVIAVAQGCKILFLDDDVIVEQGYLRGLVRLYSERAELAGVGGVDLLMTPPPLWRRVYERVTGFRSGVPGLLSLSGYGASMDHWRRQSGPFKAEWLVGCNMSFKRSSLEGIKPIDTFRGHATGEDVYLSYWASRSGELLVDPALQVSHYQSPVARDRMDQVSYRQIVNHYQILLAKNSPRYASVFLLYTGLGLVLLSAAKCLWEVVRSGKAESLPRLTGGLRGLGSVIASVLSGRARIQPL